ncbi:MAG: transporter substrate-binding domain-containing protein [Pseudomonadota bacterium]
MTRLRSAWWTAVLLGAAGTARAAEPLTVCMAENNPPLSYTVGSELRGLDVRVAQAIADELGRPLKLVPFESKFEGESTLSHEVNALLSSRVCDLASGFPLLASELGPPTRPTSRVPDHPGAKRRPLRPWVPLGTLVPSRAYHAVALGLLVREAARESATLAQPGDARIGVVAGTMAGTAVSLYRNARLRPQIVGLSRNEDALEALEAGRIDATLAPLDRYDAWRLAHPASTLRRTAYVHPLRINIGLVARDDAPGVRAAADRVIERAHGSGELERWSAATGTTWIAPVDPQVGRAIGLPDLLAE